MSLGNRAFSFDAYASAPPAAGGGSVTVIIGMITENTTLQPLTLQKIRSIASFTEQATLSTLSPYKIRAIDSLTEIATLNELTRTKIRSIGQIQEDTTLQAIQSGSITVLIGLLTETETLNALSRTKIRAIASLVENAALSVLRPQRYVPLGIVTENTTAFGLSSTKIRAIGQLQEQTILQMLVSPIRHTIGQIVETATLGTLSVPIPTIANIQVIQYNPLIAPNAALSQIEQLVEHLKQEHANIAAAINSIAPGHVEVTFVAPPKVYEGMLRVADGFHWNPGAGKGLYIYIDGAWKKVNVSA